MAAERFRTIVRVISSELDKRKVKALNKAVSVIDHAGGKIQSRLNYAQCGLTSKYEVIAKNIAGAGGGSTISENSRREKGVVNAGENDRWAATAGIIRWWHWYQRLIGMDRLEMCKQQVDSAQERLFNLQGERRHLNREATMQNEELKNVYAELLQTKRDDPRYVQLTILENKSLQDLRKIVEELNLLEKEERDHFTLLATAIKEYHVTQDLCAQRYKYISIIASVLLTAASLIASTIYNNKRTESGKIMLSTSLDQNKLALASAIQSIDEYLDAHLLPILNKLGEVEKKTDIPVVMDKTYVVIGIGILAICFLKAVFSEMP